MTELLSWIRTSVSARQTYEECPRKWWNRYRANIPSTRKPSDALHIGSWVHKCMEMYYSTPEKQAGWDEEPMALIVEAISEVIKDEENYSKKPFVWEYNCGHEAIVYTCYMNLREAIAQLELTIILTERKVQVGNWFTGIVDVIARTREGAYLIIDYKNQAGLEDLDNNLEDEQLRIYEALFEEFAKDIPGEKKFLGAAKLVAGKPSIKFKARGNTTESVEAYRFRANSPVQFLLVKKNDKISSEHVERHKEVNTEVNSKQREEDFPCKRKNCIGKYGPCDFFEHCNPPTAGEAGFSLVNGELKLGKDILAKLSKEVKETKETKETKVVEQTTTSSIIEEWI